METKRTVKPYPAELRERSVRMVREQAQEQASELAAMRSVAAKVGCTAQTLRQWVRQAERDRGERGGLTNEKRTRLKAPERENRELRQANEILRKASAFCGGGVIGLFKPKSSHRCGPAAAARPSSSPPSSGSTGLTPADCSSRSDTSCLPKPKIHTTPSWPPAMWPRRTQANLPPGKPARFRSWCSPDSRAAGLAGQDLNLALVFTGVSIVRSYVLRRVFEAVRRV